MSHPQADATSRQGRLDALRQQLAESQDGILEALAVQHSLSLLEVVSCLPRHCWQRVSGEHFVEVLGELADWGALTTIVHTPDVILEYGGPFPEGKLGHGFYNLQGGHALGGHLKPDRCAAIVFLRRPFMGLETASVQFFNEEGDAMFKVYLGRDEARWLRADQLERFTALGQRLASAEAVGS
ncbi:heme utilization cystosolic carrier protein HutX [Billgrantia gudaonensis]|uniref:Heme utilization protein HuvX n=1 Tax=Billgrantia gudaonensis TaxID=376427 RepID=A0A1G8Q4Q4_9GAMM|nr:heme utilization cystosolic carrier protein HutX [Halomonas gudaonensis]SDI99506.1 heme utilization protein HuvX [Halomonas gudaonensis]